MTVLPRLTAVAAVGVLGLGAVATGVPAAADQDVEPSLNVEVAEVLDIDGNPIPVSEDPGIPEGDGGNAPDIDGLDRGARLAIELSHALGSAEAQDMRGFQPSLYQGKWFMPKKEDVRRCIMDREANNDYRAVSAGGLYRGAYQMNRRLAIGATHMMMPEVRRELGDSGVEMLKHLRKLPTQQWNRYWQDRAFWTIWRDGNGKHHWRGGAWSC
jgi:hypothetical protein